MMDNLLVNAVLFHFKNSGTSIDPQYWSCRYSDMEVYIERVKPKKINKDDCMYPGDYPFNVWQLVEKYNKSDFIKEVKEQLIIYFIDHDKTFLDYIKKCFEIKDNTDKIENYQLELQFN
jgi:hypothetical protein